MLGTFRGFLATWPARIFFAILASAFALWGVASRDPFGAAVEGVTVGGRTVGMPEIERLYRRQLAQFSRSSGQNDPPPELRQAIAQESIQQIATQAALQAKVRALGLAVPDSALREAAFDMAAFHGKDGRFDRTTMLGVLRENGYTEAQFLDLLHDDLGQQQLLGAITAGVRVPDTLASRVYAVQHETRTADIVELAFDRAAAPATPTDAQLHRWYVNHPAAYSTPEFRRIKAVLLTPETVGRDIPVSEDDLRAAYTARHAEFALPERRSVQVLSGLPDAATADRLAGRWSIGSDWATIQKEAKQAGGASVELADATRGEFPAPELGDAAFTLPADAVAPPVKGALGWYVVRVTKITPGSNKTFEQARETLRARLVADKAADAIYDRASRIEDALSGGTKLADLPGDLGIAAVTGTLDRTGTTADGQKAPIPGSEELRQAVIAQAFAAHPGDPAKLLKPPAASGTRGNQYYALEIEAVTPPAPKPFDTVADAVRADWTRDQRRRAQDQAAASMLTGLAAGQSLAELATKAGLAVRSVPPSGRDKPGDGMPPPLLGPLFSLAKGAATMVETPDGFVVAVLTDIRQPDPATDRTGYDQLKEVLSRSLAQDVNASFAAAIRDEARPRVSGRVLADLTQTGP